LQAPIVKSIKVYAVIEQILESRENPETVHAYLRQGHFTGTANLTYDANYNQGGVRSIVTKEHIPLTMAELDRVLAERNGNK